MPIIHISIYIKTASKKILLPFFFLCFVAGVARAQQISKNDPFKDIYRSVVQVITIDGMGSGSILEGTNFVLTNYHVIEDQTIAVISLLKGENTEAEPSYLAELIAYSNDFDVALLRIISDLEGNLISENDLTSKSYWPGNVYPGLIYHVDTQPVQIGENIAILGFPATNRNRISYSMGIVSSIKHEEYFGHQIPIWLQTDAEMLPGISGGIAIDHLGRVIGLPTYLRNEPMAGTVIGNILSIKAVISAFEKERINILPSIINYNNRSSSQEIELYRNKIILEPGLYMDPFKITLISGGHQNANHLSRNCDGFIAEIPDLEILWTESSEYLKFFFEADNRIKQTSLIIELPDGRINCSRNSNIHHSKSQIEIINPHKGTYRIWIGSSNSEEYNPGILTLTVFPQ